MPVAVLMPREPQQKQERDEDPLDKIIKGLSIASTVYGFKEAGDKAEALKNQKASELEQRNLNNQRYETEYADKKSRQAVDDERWQKSHDLEKYKVGISAMDRQHEKLKKEEEVKAGKTLPASEAVALGDINASFQALADAQKAFEANPTITGPIQGKVSKFASMFELGDTGKEAKSFDAQLKANAQVIGKALEGGKLTNEDLERYKDMLPNLGDSKDAATKKVAILQSMLAQRQGAQSSALQQAGYNTGNIKLSSAPQNPNFGSNQGLADKIAGGNMNQVVNAVKGAPQPQTIVQNGHTYTLNPKTGKYE